MRILLYRIAIGTLIAATRLGLSIDGDPMRPYRQLVLERERRWLLSGALQEISMTEPKIR